MSIQESCMLQTKEQRKMAVIGLVVIAYALAAILNNLVFTGDAQAWATIVVSVAATVCFAVVYSMDREGWAAVGTYVCAVLAVFLFVVLSEWITGNGVPGMLLFAIALPFVVWGLMKPEQRGLLIPAYVLLAVIPVLYLEHAEGMIVPSYVMSAIALPFIAGWAMHRERWGLLIPAYVVLSIIPILFISEGNQNGDTLVPAYVMFAIGLPLFVAWILDRHKWGLFVPAIILFVIGLALFGMSTGLPDTIVTLGIPALGLLAGIGLLIWAFVYQGEKRQQM
jgi:hypothetical protein